MADTSAAPEGMVTPENLGNKRSTRNEPASVKPHTDREKTGAEARANSEPPGGDFQIKNEPSAENALPQDEYPGSSTDDVEKKCSKHEPKEELHEVKEEIEEETTSYIDSANRNQRQEEHPLVGRLKIKPMATLVETNAPNPQPRIHPFFAGFDDHIRSLIMNRQPHFTLNSPLMQRPPQFMYYDNSTNMKLKKMLNGHKMASATKHPTYRPYVPINVPRPPRSQVPFRTSFSTQTPPTFAGGQPDVSATPSTSYKWLPQSRPPVPNFAPPNSSPAQNVTSLKNISVPNYTPTNISATPKIIPPNNLTALNASTPNLPQLHNLSVPSMAPTQPNKVSTSSSTDDLEKHSSENTVIIKTEVDLGVDCKEELHATLNECNEFETHFMDTTDSKVQVSEDAPSNLEMSTTTLQTHILTGESVTPPVKEVLKLSAEYQLPAYSTKGLMLCKCCDFRCNRKKKLKEHFDTMHTAKNNYKCFYCIKNLAPLQCHKTVYDLEHHVAKVHRGEKRWRCRHCSKTYKCQASYKTHLEKTCSQSHPYACHMCTFTCMTEGALEKHIKSHERLQETQECPFCNKTFRKFYMKQHLIKVHTPPEEKPFQCISCDFAAVSQSVLEYHYKRSGHNKQFKCDQCDYASRSESVVKNHVNIVHKKDNPDKLVCGVDGCQVRCMHVFSLRLHRRMHSIPDSELFMCPDKDCPLKFASEQSLRHHVTKTKHHMPFKCSDCTLRFMKEESLNKHIQSVHVLDILKKMEKTHTREPVCVKNVVDVYNYVESGGVGHAVVENAHSQMYDEDSAANFGFWLGISGFGEVTNKADCDTRAPSGIGISEGKRENVEVNTMEEQEDDDEECQNLVPITCLVELKQEETGDASNAGKPGNGETVLLTKEEEEDEYMDDTEYQYVNPEISCLVECQQNATLESSPNCSEQERQGTDCLPANLVNIKLEENEAS